MFFYTYILPLPRYVLALGFTLAVGTMCIPLYMPYILFLLLVGIPIGSPMEILRTLLAIALLMILFSTAVGGLLVSMFMATRTNRMISIIASSIPIPLYYLYIYTLSPSPLPGPSIVPLLLLPLALIALAVSSIMAMAAYLTDNFALYLSVGSLLTASLSFTSTIYYPIEAFTELLGREAANMIKYNPASLASDAARSIVAGALPVDQIASLLVEALAAVALSLTVILRHSSR